MVEGVGSTWIVLSWQQDMHIDRYIIMITVGGRGTNTTVDGSESTTNVTGLLPGTEYTLRVVAVAVNGQISPPSVTIVVSTTVPGSLFLIIVRRIYSL